MIHLVLTAALAFAQVPRVWDEGEFAKIETPAVKPAWTAKHATAEAHYKLKVVEIWKSQPVYRPDREPNGYLGYLQSLSPELEWDQTKLPQTQAEWVRAGEALFEAPLRVGRIANGEVDVNNLYTRSREWYEKVKPAIGVDGQVPGYRYVIRKKGKVEVGVNACAMCHSRVMPDGFIANGPPGEFYYDAALAEDIRKSGRVPAMVEQNRQLLRRMYATPGLPRADIFDKLAGLDYQQLALLLEPHAGGVMSIDRTTPWAPVKVPDLIGVADRQYLGATGLMQHQKIEDLMRFIAVHQDSSDTERLSDEQIYALAQYLYSLKPVKNPNKASSFSKKGRAVFEREGCAACHSGSSFTNNKLMPADAIGTDPALTMETRRGTGFYRVPALNGLWYRGPFGHNGAVGELEHWFSVERLRPEYFPPGFGGLSGPQGAVKGHEYGMRLSGPDMAALFAYLRTL